MKRAFCFFILLTALISAPKVVSAFENVFTESGDPVIQADALYEPPPAIRLGRGTRPLGSLGYYRCSGPEGFPGSCKPRATCASYYATSAHYDEDRPDRYKSCNYGYGYRGVCCPDVYYSGRKPHIVKSYALQRTAYTGNYVDVSPEAISQAVKYATEQINRRFMHDHDLGRGEDDDSYWGNGIAQPLYLEEALNLGWSGYFLLLMTQYLAKEYGYKPAAVYDGGLKLDKYLNLLPPEVRDVCQSFNYKKCPYSKYRTLDGTCNNLRHPYWGAAKTITGRLLLPSYHDELWGIRMAKDGSFLPPTRFLRANILPEKDVAEKAVNSLFTFYGQMVVHDASHTPFYQCHDGLFLDCCAGYKGGNQQVSPKCYTLPIPREDGFYGPQKIDCLNFARTMLAPNYHCAAGYGNQANFQTSVLDLSLCYGKSKNESDNLRTGQYGLLKMSKVGNQYLLPFDKEAECFNTTIPGFCMTSGDLRSTIHPAITLLQTLINRFHNYCAKKMYKLNPHWNDEKLFQECRRINIAVFQHITYSEYLPLVLGWKFMFDHGILPVTKGYSYDYDETVNPWLYGEFTAAAYRCHSSVYGKLVLADEYFNVEREDDLHNHYNNPNIFYEPANFDKLLRGYLRTPQRRLDPYYDPAVSLLLMRDQRHFGLDIGSFNIHRGRDYAIRPYNDYRELCGLPRARTFQDFQDWISPDNVALLQKFYKHPDDVDLYTAGLMEAHQYDSTMGPTWWCIAGQQFKNWKAGDRFFYDLGGQPHSFTPAQLDQIRHMTMTALLCTLTTVKHVPAFAFHTISNGNPLISCSDIEAIPRFQFGPWKENPYNRR